MLSRAGRKAVTRLACESNTCTLTLRVVCTYMHGMLLSRSVCCLSFDAPTAPGLVSGAQTYRELDRVPTQTACLAYQLGHLSSISRYTSYFLGPSNACEGTSEFPAAKQGPPPPSRCCQKQRHTLYLCLMLPAPSTWQFTNANRVAIIRASGTFLPSQPPPPVHLQRFST